MAKFEQQDKDLIEAMLRHAIALSEIQAAMPLAFGERPGPDRSERLKKVSSRLERLTREHGQMKAVIEDAIHVLTYTNEDADRDALLSRLNVMKLLLECG